MQSSSSPACGAARQVAGGPVDPPPEPVGGLAEERSGVEQLVERLLDHLDDRRPALVAGREAPVVQVA